MLGPELTLYLREHSFRVDFAFEPGQEALRPGSVRAVRSIVRDQETCAPIRPRCEGVLTCTTRAAC